MKAESGLYNCKRDTWAIKHLRGWREGAWVKMWLAFWRIEGQQYKCINGDIVFGLMLFPQLFLHFSPLFPQKSSHAK